MNRFTAVTAALLLAATWSAGAAARVLPDFAELVERNHTSVVNISTSKKLEQRSDLPPGAEVPELENTPFGDLFRRFFGDREGFPERFDSQSLGSGFIISADGYVLTNHHVVEGADSIIVRMHDRRELVAEVVGTDERSDIALLKVDGGDLPVAELGSSSDLRVGEWVLAIGSPFGFEHSVTSGIVSAKGRSLPNENYVPFIQTDVAINPGNSGGPLFDLDGEVVGINAQIYSRTGGFMGLSFAIPIEVALDVVEQLKKHGKVTRGWLGVVIQEVTRELAESFGMDRAYGALVARVLPDSPAEQAGLRVGDVIVAYNGATVNSSTELPPLVGVTRVGETARVEVIREGQARTIKVFIGELDDAKIMAQATQPRAPDTNNDLGVVVAELNAEAREALQLKEGGVLVQQVLEGPAAEAGIRRGDAIVMLDNKPVGSVEDFAEIAQDLADKRSVAVLVHRRDGPLFLALKLDRDRG
ncbi:MAG: DegQ family serine endoprotease [Gammaproteobacteria bacterium]|nr:DegQ family serine endoprotease [Gammaproteobacteria bacterium]